MADQRYPVPEDQRHLTRQERQHPFRWCTAAEQAEVREEAGHAIASVDGMLTKIVVQSAPYGFTQADIDDSKQAIRLQLWHAALPNFNAWHVPQVKLTTFLCCCMHRCNADLNRRFRRRQKSRSTTTELFAGTQPAPDQSSDRLVERFAEFIYANPDQLGRYGPAILGQSAGKTNATAAKELGVATSTFNAARSEARHQLVRLFDQAESGILFT